MKLKPYTEQALNWPKEGQHILAQYCKKTITVYQAYKPSIGEFAAQHGYFGDGFSYQRMSWIKTNFLWMMYRCGWGTKADQEVILAITIPRSLFDEMLSQAVASQFTHSRFSCHEDWQSALQSSEVRLQWDPDHTPDGAKEPRRAIQLGLRGDMLQRFAKDEVLRIENITPFVRQQHLLAQTNLSRLVTPLEEIYLPAETQPRINVSLTDATTSPL